MTIYRHASKKAKFSTAFHDRVGKKNWFGTYQLTTPSNRYILFSKSKTYDSKLFETLLITESDYIELIYGPDVEEALM